MYYIVESLVLVMIEVYCCIIFFKIFFERKKKSKLFCFWVVAALVTGLYFGAFILRENLVLKIIVVLLMICAAMYAIFKVSIWKSMLLAVIYQSLLLVVDYATYILYYINDNQSYTKYSAVILLGKAVVLLAVIAVKKIFKKHFLPETNRSWYMSFPLCTMMLIVIMVPITADVTADQANLFLAVALGLIGITVFDFFYIGELQSRVEEKRQYELQLQKNAADIEKYQVIAKKDAIKDGMLHEFGNHISCMGSLYVEKRYEELGEYLKDLGYDLLKLDNHIETNHAFFNSVLNHKYCEAAGAGIDFVCVTNDLAEVKMEKKNIVVILSNLLNNAIEACECCECKQIEVHMEKTSNSLDISVINNHNNKVIYEKGIIRTSKKTKPEEHGKGMKNIISSIEECGGKYNISYNDSKFGFFVSIPQ